MRTSYAQLQRLGQWLLRAQGFRAREERLKDGRRFFVYARSGTGTGPKILLVHGLGGAATSFAPIAKALCALSPEVLIVDLPGHGKAVLGPGERPASAEKLVEALEQIVAAEKEPVLLVGNSLGGALVLGVALSMPERIAGVVGLSPAGAPFSEDETKEVRSIFRGGSASGRDLGRRLFHSPPWSVRFVSSGLGAHMEGPAVQHLVGNIKAGEQGLPDAGLRALRVPALILWGDADAVLPKSGAEYFRRVLPKGSVEILERCGHLPQVERPRKVLARLREFIEKLPPRRLPA